MFRNRKIILIFSIIVLAVSMAACGKKSEVKENKKMIITTLFPQYDFARQIVGDKFEVRLLLPPGGDSHSYEPTPRDIIDINNAELFVYTGDDMEAWAKTILAGIDNKELNVLDLSKNIALLNTGEHDNETDTDHMDETHEENHNSHIEGEKHSEEEYTHEEHEEENIFGHTHSHNVDPHYFTSPKNAMIMLTDIYEEIVELDPENGEYYKKNYDAYMEKLVDIDEEIYEIVENADYDTIYFGGKFALLYFVQEYDLQYVSPFDSCAHEAEANPKSIVEIIECMEQHGVNTVFYEELVDPRVANIIAEEAKGEALLLHSCHNVSKEEFEQGVTYVELMKMNAEHLRTGLYK